MSERGAERPASRGERRETRPKGESRPGEPAKPASSEPERGREADARGARSAASERSERASTAVGWGGSRCGGGPGGLKGRGPVGAAEQALSEGAQATEDILLSGRERAEGFLCVCGSGLRHL